MMQQIIRSKIAAVLSYITGTNRNITLLYLVSIIYISLNAYLVYRELYWSLMLPLFLVLLYLYFFRLDVVILLIAFLTPLAINVTDFDFGVGISLPTEPLMFGVLVLFIVRIFFGMDADPRVWRHPLSVIIMLQLGWMLITTLTSQLPVVSLKHLMARLWFVIPFYFLAVPLFQKMKNVRWFIWLYTVALIGVVAYTTVSHSRWNFSEEASHWVMEPFYNDHTAYGAILALFVPVIFSFSFSGRYSPLARFFGVVSLLTLLMALYLSYSRAAWLSMAMATSILLIILLRIRFRYIAFSAVILGMLFYLFQFEIIDYLEKNKQDSSANFVEHVRSISNISTDDSNLERINRWQSAIRMFLDRPVFGFGPGTYQFEYGPYQRSVEKTLISTNAGDRGNAHSEYIGPLAEQGLPGLLFILLILGYVIYTSIRVFKHSPVREARVLSLGILIGLITYFAHGIMNNFLDTDKASVPVWGFMAVLVAFDLYHSGFSGKAGEKPEPSIKQGGEELRA